MLVVKIEFYKLDFLSCWPTILHFLPSLFFPFFLRSSFPRSTDLNQILRTNPFVLHSPHQLDPNQTQNKPFHSSFSPSLRRLGLVRVIAWVQFEPLPKAFFMVSIFHLCWVCVSVISFARFMFIFLLRCGLVFLISLLGLCFYSLLLSFHFTKLEPQRLNLAHQTRVS